MYTLNSKKLFFMKVDYKTTKGKEPITVEGYCNTIRGFPIVSMAYMLKMKKNTID